MKPIFLAAVLCLVLAACSSTGRQVARLPVPPGAPASQARIVVPDAPLQCVPYTRKISRVSIRGDAWTWWATAGGRYRRGAVPAVGSVLVWKRTARLRRGHLAVIRAIVSDREIVVDQANWLNRGRIHLNVPVRDVSADNDWSAVRVWYTPGHSYGVRTYATHGFIYPERITAAQ